MSKQTNTSNGLSDYDTGAAPDLPRAEVRPPNYRSLKPLADRHSRKLRLDGSPTRPAGDELAIDPFAISRDAYLEQLAAHNYSEGTIDGRRDAIRVFLRWCAQRTLLCPAEISPCTLEAYQGWLWQYTKSDGNRLSSSTQRQRIGTLKDWFRWMTKRQIISTDPACDLRLPRMETRLPATALTSAEVQKLLRVPNTRSPLGIRDRAILEVLYASGVRRAEVCRLGLPDLDFERRTLRIRRGKGRKDRVVPMGERAIWWLRRYLAEVRPRLCLDKLEETVFLAERGHPFNHDVLSHMVTAMLTASGLARKGSCHLLRHTCATHMLEGGADIRFIQQLLGHEKLETTALYTQVTITQLREVYARCHPAAHLAKGRGGP